MSFKRNTLIAAAVLICVCAQAQLAIYKTKITATDIGAGNTVHLTVGGLTIIDLTNGVSVWFLVLQKSGQFAFQTNNWALTTILGTAGKSYMVATLATNFFDTGNSFRSDFFFAKGQNVSTDIGLLSGERFLIPKTFKLVGRSVHPDQNRLPVAEESAGTLSLDIKATQAQNAAGSTLADAIKTIEDALKAQGLSGP